MNRLNTYKPRYEAKILTAYTQTLSVRDEQLKVTGFEFEMWGINNSLASLLQCRREGRVAVPSLSVYCQDKRLDHY